MLPDTTVIHTHGTFAVIAECQPVLFKDWTMVALHRVQHSAMDSMFLRAFLLRDVQWLVFDLRAVARSLTVEIPQFPPRDTDGLVLYTLRREFPSVDDFQAKAYLHIVDLSEVCSPVFRGHAEPIHQLRAA